MLPHNPFPRVKHCWILLLLCSVIHQLYAQPHTPSVSTRQPSARQQIISQADSLLLKSKPDTAALLLDQVIQTAMPQKDTAALFQTHLELGKTYLVRERFDEALSHYLNSLNYVVAATDHRQIADAYIGIGVVYSRLHNYDKAKDYLLRSLQLLPDTDKDRLKALVNLGGIYMETGDREHTVAIHEEALLLATRLGAAGIRATLYTNLSNFYIKEKSWRQAESNARESLRIRDSLSRPLSVITYNNLGYALVQSGRIQEGMACYEKALPSATLAEQQQLLYNLRGGSIASGNYQQALKYYDRYDAVKDSIAKKQYEKRVAELTAVYETAQKQQRIAALEAENRAKQKQIVELTIGSLLLLLLVSGIIYLRFKNINVTQELKQSKTRRQLLQVQLNPHFIFNALTHIQQYIYKNEAQHSMEYLNSFSRLIRIILESSDKENTTLEEEIEMLEHYLKLQQSGSHPPFTYTFQVDPTLDTSDTLLPIMLLQPFVENAVIHGVKKRGQGHITISFDNQSDHLHVCIADNGSGLQTVADNTAGSLHRSMGRAIVDQRIAEFNKVSRRQIKLWIAPTSDHPDFPGTSVHLHIPGPLNNPRQ